jgi:TRAP-type C4-dicarboxylate transport system permease small subunit
MMLHISIDVGGRYLFSSPIPGTYEIDQMLMVFVVFLGLAYTQATKSHIKTEMLVRFFPPRGQLITEIFSHLIFFFVFFLLLWESMNQALISWDEKEFVTGLVNIPRYPARFAIPVGAFLVCLQLVFDIVDRFMALLSGKRGANV